MTPSLGSQRQAQLMLEPCQSKKISNMQQWISACNIFLSVYAECFPTETLQLKYCEVVRDLAFKSGDWCWYDEQFHYLWQSHPKQYPWDQIHWELWLRASTSIHKQLLFTNKSLTEPLQQIGQLLFPKGTCWGFQARRHYSSCLLQMWCKTPRQSLFHSWFP